MAARSTIALSVCTAAPVQTHHPPGGHRQQPGQTGGRAIIHGGAPRRCRRAVARPAARRLPGRRLCSHPSDTALQ